MPSPKPIHPQAVPAALEKAVRYRLLNEPGEAESICRDVLAVDPDNHDAKLTLLLAVTDQFVRHDAASRMREALTLASAMGTPYEQTYYTGIVHERYAKAHHRTGTPGCGFRAYDVLLEAMHCFEEAEKLRPEDNDDAVLRWNSCVRLIERHSDLRPAPREEHIPLTLE